MKRPPKPLIAVIVLLALAGAAAVAWSNGLLPQSLFGRNGRDPSVVRVMGNIEATDADVAFKIPGRVATRPIDEGQWVDAGQTVATLETADLRAELALRQAERDAAQAAVDELRAGSRQEEKDAAFAAMQKAYFVAEEFAVGLRGQQKKIAQDEYEAAKAEALRLERELGRAANLIERNVVSQEQYDQVKTAYQVAARRLAQAGQQLSLALEGSRVEQVDQAFAALDQAIASYDLVMAGPRKEDIRQGEARLTQATAAVQLAQTKIDYATVTSPFGGIVLSKNIEPGEYVAPGTPVVTLGDLKNVWLRAYITEEDLKRVKVGQKAEVSISSRGKPYEGRVSFIAGKAEFTPKNVQTEKERVKLVYRVKIDVHNDAMELKPGMPADAVILVE